VAKNQESKPWKVEKGAAGDGKNRGKKRDVKSWGKCSPGTRIQTETCKHLEKKENRTAGCKKRQEKRGGDPSKGILICVEEGFKAQTSKGGEGKALKVKIRKF